MKFKCLISGCVYDFNEPLDIKSMQVSLDYKQVEEPVKVPVVSATVVPVAPVKPAPAKPAPVPPVAPTAV